MDAHFECEELEQCEGVGMRQDKRRDVCGQLKAEITQRVHAEVRQAHYGLGTSLCRVRVCCVGARIRRKGMCQKWHQREDGVSRSGTLSKSADR